MAVHYGHAVWRGNLREGEGTVRLGKNGHEERYTAVARFENGPGGTSPEELIGAAHAGCFSMALANELAEAGYNPAELETEAKVTIDKTGGGYKIMSVELSLNAHVPGISNDEFQRISNGAKENCPVSKALKQGVDITLNAKLES